MPRLLIPGPFEPTLQFRFSVFSSKLKGAFFSCRAMTLPTFDNSPLELHHGNGSFFVKGKTKWNPIQIQCYHFEGITMLDFWSYLFQHQKVSEAEDRYASFYKHDLRLSVLDPIEAPVGTWVLRDAFFENVDFGQFDRSSDQIAEVNATIRYDYAEFKPFF